MPDHPVVMKATQLHQDGIQLHTDGQLEPAIAKLEEALATGIREPFRRNWILKDLARYRREFERTKSVSDSD